MTVLATTPFVPINEIISEIGVDISMQSEKI